MCTHFDEEKELCKVYATPLFPVECAVYVCGIRKYSEQEMAEIKKIHHKELMKQMMGM